MDKIQGFAGIPYKDQPSTIQDWQKIYVEDVATLKSRIKELEAEKDALKAVIEYGCAESSCPMWANLKNYEAENDALYLGISSLQSRIKELEAENEDQLYTITVLKETEAQLTTRVKELEATIAKCDTKILSLESDRRRDAIDGQAGMDLDHNRIKELEADVQKWIKIAGENQKSANQSADRVRELEVVLAGLLSYYPYPLTKDRDGRIRKLSEL